MPYKALKISDSPDQTSTRRSVIQFDIDRPNYALDALLAFAVPSIVIGMGIVLPGDFSLAAVKTSTPASVTSKVCSTRISIEP